MRKNELFETEKFNRYALVKEDLHRTAKKSNWISKQGFTVVTRKQDMSMQVEPSRRNLMKDGFSTIQQNSSSFAAVVAEPYEDPSLEPGFVRTTKDFLRQSLIKQVEAKIRKEELQAMNQSCNIQSGDLSSGLSFFQNQQQQQLSRAGHN